MAATNRFEAEGALDLHKRIHEMDQTLDSVVTRLVQAEQRLDNASQAFVEQADKLAQAKRQIKMLYAAKANKRDTRSSSSQTPDPEPTGYKCHINCPDRYHDDEAIALEHKQAFTKDAADKRAARREAAIAAREAAQEKVDA